MAWKMAALYLLQKVCMWSLVDARLVVHSNVNIGHCKDANSRCAVPIY